jgi:mono/diheme cytochrome c family protein
VPRLIAAALAVYLTALSVALPSAQAQPDGKFIFRFDTFGSEQLWTDFLQMQHVIADSVSPKTALSVGLKVDVDALPPALIDALKASPPQVNLDDPAVTVQLLKLNAVVGVSGMVVGANNNLVKVGITCALCHSTVDDSFAPGIGHRLDGWANTTLNAGAIIALSPAISDKTTYQGWGPGKYDPRFRIFDGATPLPLNSPSIPVVIPSIFGLQGVGFETFNGDGPISYWNNYVAVTQMGGHGSFSDSRIGVSVIQTPDQVTPKLPALMQYQLSLQTPPAPPPDGSANRAAARRGEDLFMGAAGCATCHKPPLFTDVASGPDPSVPVLHDPSEIPTNAAYAARSATKKWRTTPLRALWQHPPYFHDGSAADLLDVVNRYNNDPRFSLGLTERQKTDLVEFLKTL